MTNHKISICTLYSRRSSHLHNLVQGLVESKMHIMELVIICMNDSLPELPSTPFQIKSSIINSPHKLLLAEARTKASSIANGDFLIFLDRDLRNCHNTGWCVTLKTLLLRSKFH